MTLTRPGPGVITRPGRVIQRQALPLFCRDGNQSQWVGDVNKRRRPLMFAKSCQRQLLFFVLLLALTLIFLPSLGYAQTVTGSLQGTVYDAQGAVVPGVDVVVRN